MYIEVSERWAPPYCGYRRECDQFTTFTTIWQATLQNDEYENEIRTHSSHLIQIFRKYQTPVVRQAPCSPDMTPKFSLFPKLKRSLKGKRFQTREDIMTATTGDYFEGD